METPPKTGRFAEIDLLRGIAVVLMIIYHALFDLVFFQEWELNLESGPFWAIGRSAAVLFVGLAGVSMSLAWTRKHGKKEQPFIQRGLQLLGLGFILTLFTWIVFPSNVIWFGVLHLIGTGLILGIIFLERPRAAAIVGSILTILGIYFSMPTIQTQLPFIIPVFPVSFSTFDYFPLLPWLGVFLLGISTGNYLYPHGNPRREWTWNGNGIIEKTLKWMGQNSLILYFAHQPVIVGSLLVLQLLGH